MIHIQKGPEPPSLTAYRQQPYATYDGYADKDALRAALLRDQGHICAYCMRRIYNDRNKMKIEHWRPQSQLNNEAEKLDYKIMLGVCDGCRGSLDKYTTCDEHRHDAELYVNPLDAGMMETISYDRSGHIKSSVPRIDKDLHEILNLNCEQAPSRLVQNRKAIYQECRKQLYKQQQRGLWSKRTIQQVLVTYSSGDAGRKTPFIGVVQYVLQKTLERAK